MTYQSNTSQKHVFIVALIYTFALIALGLVFILGNTYDIPFEKFTGDPAFITNSSPFIGIISNIGALMWCTTASICFYAGGLLWSFGNKNYALFLIYSGVFTAILLIDDFFMLHDSAVYYIINHDFAQYSIYLSYAIFALWYVFNFYKVILKQNYILIGLAFFFLGISVLIDIIFESVGLQYFIEDSFKFLGIISWMLFYIITSHQLVIEHHNLLPSKTLKV